MTASATPRRPSAIDALGEAISHMRAKLFPFSFGGWITLGLASLIESCGTGSGTGGFPNTLGSPGSFPDPTRAIEQAAAWVTAHVVILVSALLALMVVSLLFMWLRSRAIFVYIDDVASGRFDLVRPWSLHAGHADSFFAVSLIAQGAAFILLVLIVGLFGFFVLWARANDWAGGAIALGIIPIVFLFFFGVVAAGLLSMALRDFVAPLQVSRNVGAAEAGGIFLSMLSQNPGLFIGYALLKFAVGIAVGIVVTILGCLTCCIGLLPLVNQTLFQPVYYADRAWSLKLLAQMGDNVFETGNPPPSAPVAQVEEDSGDALTGPIDLSAIDWETPPQS